MRTQFSLNTLARTLVARDTAGSPRRRKEMPITVRRHLSLTGSLLLVALLAAACTPQSGTEPSSKARSVMVTKTGTAPPTRPVTATRDPQVIVDALNTAGLALCHSDYSDAAQYDPYGIVGATVIWRLFPHRSAVSVPGIPGALSCVTASQPDTGDIEIDVYPSAINAQGALRQVDRLWLAAWLYGNVAILVDQTTPLPVAQVEREVLDHIPGTVLAGWY